MSNQVCERIVLGTDLTHGRGAASDCQSQTCTERVGLKLSALLTGNTVYDKEHV